MSAHVHTASFWTSTPALLIVAAVCALLLGLALFALLASGLRRHGLSARVDRFTASFVPPAQAALAEPLVKERERELVDRLFAGKGWWVAFGEKLELARIERSPGQVVLIAAVATLAAALVVSLVSGTSLLAIPVLALGPVAMLTMVNQRLARQRKLFADQLPSHVQELASALRAGHSLVSGLRTIADSAAEPMRTELERALADEQLGVPLHAALEPMAQRMGSDDVKQVALVAALHERTGGNMAAVLDHVADGVRERLELRRELRSLTAQARLSRWVVTLLPLILLLVISLENSSYMRPFFHTSTGVVLLLVACGMVVAGSLVMKAIVDVEE